jgi:protein involved in polysaccharide export with SLBB domain
MQRLQHRRLRQSFLTSFFFAAALLCAAVPRVFAPASAQSLRSVPEGEYTLAAQDKIRIRAHEWRPSRDELFEWKAFNTDYTVGASGRLGLPLVGEIDVTGMTTAQLSNAIGDRMQQRIGLASPPDVAIEIIECRPIYLVGQIEKPGAFAYRPGLTVLQAIALAGGLRRPQLGSRLERELIATRSDMVSGMSELRAVIARKARIETELQGGRDVRFPEQLNRVAAVDGVALLMQQERAIFTARTNAYNNQINALQQLSKYLDEEFKYLNGQLATHKSIVGFSQVELDGIALLAQKGLATQSRKLGLERNMAQLQSDRLRLETAIAGNRQEFSKAALGLVDLKAKRDIELASDLRATQSKLEETTRRIETGRQLIDEATSFGMLQVTDQLRESGPEAGYTILRNERARMTEIRAGETTALLPGDTVKVSLSVEPSANAMTTMRGVQGGLLTPIKTELPSSK